MQKKPNNFGDFWLFLCVDNPLTAVISGYYRLVFLKVPGCPTSRMDNPTA